MRPRARKKQLVIEELKGECIVYDRKTKKAHGLNSTVAWIWRHCDGATDVQEMALHFEREFGCADSLDLILAGIQQLEAANLLVQRSGGSTESTSSGGPAMSRRSVVAAGSALFPVISTILVPTAAAAKSKPDKPKKPKEK